jgi:amino acid transporter, AAT family
MIESKFKYLPGPLALLVTFLLGWGLWQLLFAPNGVMQLYTPMYGFALITVYFFVLLAMTDIFALDDPAAHPGRGLLLLALSFTALFIIFFGFFWSFLGKFGVTYFSPHAIIAAGGTGAEYYNARENSSLAIIYLAASFVWITTVWRLALGAYPWQQSGRFGAGVARFFGISFFAWIIYLVLFHPHVTSLFHPAQTFAGVPPWWEETAMTASAYFNLGWVLAAVFLLLLMETAWEFKPAGLLKEENRLGMVLSPALTLLLSAAAGYLVLRGLGGVMNLIWDEAFIGGSYLDAPYFRHLHVAEISGFLIMGLFIWRVFFHNAPAGLPWMARGAVRTGAILLIGLLLRWFYYAEGIGTAFLDRVPGFAQPDDTPLAWTILMLSLILAYERFFKAYPLRRG